MRHKKGSFFFILDVFIGSFIFLVTLFLILSFKVSAPETEGLSAKIDSFTQVVFELPVSSYENSYKDSLKSNKELWPSPLLTTDELIYYLYSNGYNETAYNLTKSLTFMLLSDYVGINYSVDGQTVYIRHADKKERSQTVISNRKITYDLINATSYFSVPVKTEVILWQ